MCYKFRLTLSEEPLTVDTDVVVDLSPGRLIPSLVKQAVFIRDGGKCVECGWVILLIWMVWVHF